MNKQKFQIWLPVLLSLSMIAGMFLGYKIRDSVPGRGFFSLESRSSIQEILDLIENKYVDSIDLNQLKDTAVQAILQKLDPHSVYIPATELEDINNDIRGSFFGIGVEFEMFNDTLNVVHVLNEGPAKKAGILQGDQFIKANTKIIAGKKINADSVRQLLRGAQGSTVSIELLRNGKKITIPVNRNIVTISSIDAAYMLNSNLGLIRINKFSSQTYKEFMNALTTLKQKGMQELILDLRDNGGGILDEAVEIADEFLEGDKLITYTQGLHFPKKEYRCRRTGQFEKGKLIVLCNEGSASASEVLMGALQDWDRATIIGRRSFGKGLVQEQYDLNDRSAVRLTIARYYTPSGRSIQRSYANGDKAYFEEIENRIQNGSEKNNYYSSIDSTKSFTTPAGKKLYGGGGITPDEIIKTDSDYTAYSDKLLLSSRVIHQFAYDIYIHNKKIFIPYSKATDYAKGFTINAEIWSSFISYAQKNGITFSKLTPIEEQQIKQFLKYNIAGIMLDKNGYFEVINQEDTFIKIALSRLK